MKTLSTQRRQSMAAITGLLAVALGAFGAHVLKETLVAQGTLEIWKTAALYHLVHSVLLFMVSSKDKWIPAWWSLLGGVIVFSGSLYLLAITGISKLGMVTPLGGFALLAGWLLLVLKAGKSEGESG